MFDLLPNDPVSHGIDIEPGHITPDPVGLQEGNAAAHERIGHLGAGEAISLVEHLPKRPVRKLGEKKPSEQGPRPAGKPFMDGDNRSVVLLNLLFPQGQIGDEGDVEIFLYHSVSASAAIEFD